MATFSAVGASTAVRVEAGQRLTISITNTFVAKVRLERQQGSRWEIVREYRAAGASDALPTETSAQYYRLRCYAYTSGTVTYTIAAAAAAVAGAAPAAVDNGAVQAVLRINDANGTHVITFSAPDETGNRTITIPSLGGNVTLSLLELAQLHTAVKVFGAVATAAGVAALGFGSTSATGLLINVIEEVVDLTAAGAKFKALTTAIPSGAVILSAQANIDTLAVAGGTSVKVALGLNGGDVDKYGITSALTKNLKIDTIPDWAVLSGAEQIDVNAVVTNGSALGDTNFSAGSVRVRIVYAVPVSLPDAA